jgi:translation elongation factor EF-4
VQVAPEQSDTLGRGLRCGFLGMLHMEVVQQRLREEHQVDVLVTAPTVPLVATHADGTREVILSPASLPRAALEGHAGTSLEEPLVSVTLISPAEHVGALISECEGRSGVQQDQRYLGADRAVLRYTLPLAEIATDFHDRVKSISNGFASLDYEPVTLKSQQFGALNLTPNPTRTQTLILTFKPDPLTLTLTQPRP